MIFDRPLPFKEALRARAARAVMPNNLTASQLGHLAPELAERSQMIAGLTNADVGQRLDDLLDGLMHGQFNVAHVRLEMKRFLRSIGYEPEPGRRGTISDLSTDARLNLIIDTQVRMATGYGQYAQGLTRGAMFVAPCWEFVRLEPRKEPRDWPRVWAEHGGKFYTGGGPYPQGRMIAPKTSSIWTAISRFGLPYAPFDFNSGMGLFGIERDECIRLGIIRADAPLQQPPVPRFEKAVPGHLTAPFKAALLEGLGPGYKWVGDQLTHE